MNKREELLNYMESLIEDETIAEVITSRDKQGEDFLQSYRFQWNSYYNLYRGKPDTAKQAFKGRANLVIPYAYSTVETVHPRLCVNKPKVILAPRGPEDLKNSENCQRTVDYYLDLMNWKKTYKQWVKPMLWYGVSVLKLDWVKTDNYQGPRAQILDLAGGDFKWDPTATALSDSWCIHTYELPVGVIKDNKNYKNRDKVKEGDYTPSLSRLERLQAFGHSFSKDSMKKMAKITEYWGPYDLNKDGIEENCKIVIANDKVVLEAIPNPLPHKKNPFIMIVDVDMPGEVVGIGEIEPIESLCYELNDTRNQRMDNVTMIMHRMWKKFKGADINDSQLIWRPNGIVEVGDMNGLQPIDVPDVTKSAYNEETMIKGDIEMANGVQDFSPNLGSKANNASETTARGMAMQQEMANPRFQLKLDNIEDGVIEFGRQLWSLIYKYMPKKVYVRVVGKDNKYQFNELNKADVKGQYDIQVEMGTTQPQNRLTRRAEARELVAAVGPYSQLDPTIMQKFKQSLNYLMDTYELPESTQEDMTPIPQGQMAQAQGGLSNMGKEGMYGQMGQTLGGAQGNYQPTELQGLATGPQVPGQPA